MSKVIYAPVLTEPGLWTSTLCWKKKQHAVKSLAESLGWMGWRELKETEEFGSCVNH